jgi:hypothetical protein
MHDTTTRGEGPVDQPGLGRDDGVAAGHLAPDPDPLVAPVPLARLADVVPRSRVAVAGTVVDVAVVPWAGGPTCEAMLDDGTGSIVLAFPGRAQVTGIDTGRVLVAGGAAVVHRGRLVLMNPYLWFDAPTGPR